MKPYVLLISHLIQWYNFIIMDIIHCLDENSIDPDQLALLKPADLDLHCFQMRVQNFQNFIKSNVRSLVLSWF